MRLPVLDRGGSNRFGAFTTTSVQLRLAGSLIKLTLKITNRPLRGDSWALRCSDVSNRGLAATAIHLRIERYPLAFYEARPTGSFQRARMHEDVFPTVIRLNEAITFLHAVKFHFACTSSTVFG